MGDNSEVIDLSLAIAERDLEQLPPRAVFNVVWAGEGRSFEAWLREIPEAFLPHLDAEDDLTRRPPSGSPSVLEWTWLALELRDIAQGLIERLGPVAEGLSRPEDKYEGSERCFDRAGRPGEGA